MPSVSEATTPAPPVPPAERAAAPSSASVPARPKARDGSGGGSGGGGGGGGGGGANPALPIGQRWIEAAKRSDRAEMEALLEEDDSLVAYKARGIGHTAMHWAASQGDRQLMQWLVSLGGDVNARNTSEATPLHTAAGSGQAMSLEWLLQHGADASLANDDDATPAAIARRKGRDDLARTLEAHLASPAPPVTDVPAPSTAASWFDGHEEEVD